jgi:hypothetical protein
MSMDSDHALPIAASTASIVRSLVRSAISMPAPASMLHARRKACFASSVARCQPAVSRSAIRRGVLAGGSSTGPETPGKPGSPPARAEISRATVHVSARLAASTPVQL